MRKFLPAIGAVAVVVAFTAVRIGQSEGPAHDYAGSKKCRICHNTESKGKMNDVWAKTNHAHAYERLLTKEAKEAAKKLSIAEPEKSGECLRCHATAYGFTKKPVTKVVKVEEGVGCESCHGPGSDYSNLTIMPEREKAIATGMTYPAKDGCTKCHNAESPTWNPERYTDKNGNKVGFDFEVLWEMIKHSIPEKK
ncbi:MAG: multiheme c-type cytochrome [bacterium]|nr:multiheme c-type cytochrome [bacterium]